MKLTVALVDDNGASYSGEIVLQPQVSSEAVVFDRAPSANDVQSPLVDFRLPMRAFIKKYGQGKSGPGLFALLVAHLAGGRVGVGVERADVERAWNRMTALTGMRFNGAFAVRAKDNGWIDSPKRGQYTLLSSWQDAL